MTTKRSSVLSDIDGSLSGMTGIAQVETGKWQGFDLKDVNLPIAFAALGNDRPVDAPSMGFEEFWVTASIEMWCASADLEAWIGKVHTAIMADVTQGGNALNTHRNTCTPFSVDPSRGLAGFEMTFLIHIRHPFGTP